MLTLLPMMMKMITMEINSVRQEKNNVVSGDDSAAIPTATDDNDIIVSTDVANFINSNNFEPTHLQAGVILLEDFEHESQTKMHLGGPLEARIRVQKLLEHLDSPERINTRKILS